MWKHKLIKIPVGGGKKMYEIVGKDVVEGDLVTEIWFNVILFHVFRL